MVHLRLLLVIVILSLLVTFGKIYSHVWVLNWLIVPQLDEKNEVVNKCLEGYLHYFTSKKQSQGIDCLSLAEWWYNTSFHSS